MEYGAKKEAEIAPAEPATVIDREEWAANVRQQQMLKVKLSATTCKYWAPLTLQAEDTDWTSSCVLRQEENKQKHKHMSVRFKHHEEDNEDKSEAKLLTNGEES